MLKASEDKTFPGAIVASLASPWGQAISAGDPANTYFGSYREVFARDLYEAWTGLVADGDLATARDATLFLFERQQQPDGSMPRNSLVNGKTRARLVQHPARRGGLPDPDGRPARAAPTPSLYAEPHQAGGELRHRARPGVRRRALGGAERLLAVDDRRRDRRPRRRGRPRRRERRRGVGARVWLGVADDWQRSIKGWTVTTNGPLSPHPYFIRLSKTGDPNAAITYNVGNGGPTLDQRTVIDAGFLELVRLGELPANDPDVARSRCRSSTRRSSRRRRAAPAGTATTATATATAPRDGHPWAPSGQGTGHLWPVLSAERGEQDLAAGRRGRRGVAARRHGRVRLRASG